MPPPKEPDQAFMPTSNDALYSNFDQERSCSRYLPGRAAAHRSDECAIFDSSHSSEMSSRTHTPQGARSYFQPPNREQISSASSMPLSTAADGLEPTDETFWYNLHIEALENFQRERATWQKMTDRLRQDIERLKEELITTRSSSRKDSAFYSMGSIGKENDKIFFNPNTVSRAHEKLKELSVVSPALSPQTNSPLEPVPEPTTNDWGSMTGRKASSASRLPSIQEDAGFQPTPLKRVSIAEPEDDPMEIRESSIVFQEDPPSPPTTAKPLSPPPPEYIKHAGHTPARASQRGSFVEPDHENNPNKSDAKKDDPFALDGTDDDPELQSPKILPTDLTGDLGMLSALDEKLKEVAENPEENEPEVLKTAEDVESAGQGTEHAEPVIELKTKSSMNFGVQLGRLR